MENYAGRYKSLADHAQELTEETTKIPEPLRNYIDYESMARDMDLNGDGFTIELTYDEVHVFRAYWSPVPGDRVAFRPGPFGRHTVSKTVSKS
jgi:hypothetical protein